MGLSLCGTRISNYLNSVRFGGISPVEAAVRELAASGVAVGGKVFRESRGLDQGFCYGQLVDSRLADKNREE